MKAVAGQSRCGGIDPGFLGEGQKVPFIGHQKIKDSTEKIRVLDPITDLIGGDSAQIQKSNAQGFIGKDESQSLQSHRHEKFMRRRLIGTGLAIFYVGFYLN
jgi:hypothetical protein